MSGGTLYRAARLESLSAALADRLKTELPGDPLTPVRILVASGAQAHWLRQELAERRGIQANVSFLRAADLPLEVARRAGSAVDPSVGELWTTEALAWAVAEVLPDLLGDEAFEVVAVYAAEEPAGEASGPGGAGAPAPGVPITGRFFALSSELARVLDRCQRLRPDLLRAWRRGEDDAGEAGAVAPWLPRLWRALARHMRVPDAVARLDEALAALATPARPLPDDERLWVFGVGALDPLHLEALVGLLERDQAALFLPTSSDVAWKATRSMVAGDTAWGRRGRRDEAAVEALRGLRDAGNPLRASLGRAQRDLGIALAAAWPDPEDATASLDAPFSLASPSADAGADSCALNVLKAQLVSDAAPPEGPAKPCVLAPGDDSLQLHTCYGPRRQVEVLREALLHLLEDHPELEPRDVLVLTPDLATYAPLVSAAFAQGAWLRDGGSWAPSCAPRLPVEVTDVAVRTVNPVADALLRVLDLVDGRLEVSVVFDLLALEPVRARFGLSADQLSDLEAWVRDVGVRWGRDAVHRAACGLPEDPQNSWSWGLDRLAYGVARADDGDALLRAGAAPDGDAFNPVVDLVVAYDAAEGDGTFALGKLFEFWARLTDSLDALRDPRPLAEWADALQAAVGHLTRAEGRRAWQPRQVLDAVARLRVPSGAREVSRAAVQACLAGRFEQGLLRARPGSITLAALRPGHVLPRRVICLLGLDEGSFPRNPSRPAFDPTTRAPRVTDPTTRDRDRGAFLDALLGAREHLLVLYTGRDERTNEERPPAIPVAELRDALDATFLPASGSGSAVDALTRAHPLQPFAASCFRADRPAASTGPATPWSFDERLLERQAAFATQGGESSEFFPQAGPEGASSPPEPLELEELIRFLKNPSRRLLQSQLKLTLRDDADLIPPSDREPCEANALDRWKLTEALRVACSEGEAAEAVAGAWLATGQLQPGAPGRRLASAALEKVEGLLRELTPWLGPPGGWREPDEPLRVDVAFEAERLMGQVEDVHGAFLVSVTVGAVSAEGLLASWVRLLACAATDPSRRWRAIHLGVKCPAKSGAWQIAGEGLDLGALTPAARRALARQRLGELLELAREGLRAPLPFFPKASFAFGKALAWAGLDAPGVLSGGLDAIEPEALAKAMKSASTGWRGGGWGGRCDLDDPYVRRVYADRCPLFEGGEDRGEPALSFAAPALAVWGPLLRARCTYARKAPKSGLGPVKSWLKEFPR